MLKKVSIKNCLSFEDFVMNLERVNVLVGKNNAGKTNFCHALQFLRLSQKTDINDAFRRSMGGTAQFLNFLSARKTADFELECVFPNPESRNEKITFFYELSIRQGNEENGKSVLAVSKETLRMKRGGSKVKVLINRNSKGKATLAREINAPTSINETISPGVTMLNELVDSEEYRMANQFKKFLGSIINFDIEPSYLKKTEIVNFESLLTGEGNNLFYSIFWLKNENKRLYEEYLELIQLAEPNIRTIEFREELITRPPHIAFPVFNNQFYADSLSAGTLRFMGLSMILIMAEIFFNDLKIYPVFTIEEPENGIHVGLLKMLYQICKESPGQFIFTSHSPYMIDLFDDNLNGLKVFDNKDGKTVLFKISKTKIKKLLNKMPLGEMHFHEVFTA